MADMADKGQWMLLPYEDVKHLPGLCLSPIGVVPQHACRPRTIAHYTFYGVNPESVPLTAPEAMQFGQTLHRLLHQLGEADPRHGPPFVIKVDMSDGFYRIRLNPAHAVRLGVIFPPDPCSRSLVAFPMVLPMGWVNSPPIFCSATETVADLTNQRIASRIRPAPTHHLEPHALALDDPHPLTVGPPKS